MSYSRYLKEEAAHPRGDLGKNIAAADFPIVVGYELNNESQSEIAYTQNELDEILDYLAPLGSNQTTQIPYSLNPLDELEPKDTPAGPGIEQLPLEERVVKITKIQLRRIIREEKRKMVEDCGGPHVEDDMLAPVAVEPAAAEFAVVESAMPEQEMIIEMEVAQRSLEQVVESVQQAAALCPNCGPGVAVQAPLVEAMVAQAVALQETLDAQLELVTESTDVGTGADLDMADDVAILPPGLEDLI
jgi:hypothetical protein